MSETQYTIGDIIESSLMLPADLEGRDTAVPAERFFRVKRYRVTGLEDMGGTFAPRVLFAGYEVLAADDPRVLDWLRMNWTPPGDMLGVHNDE